MGTMKIVLTEHFVIFKLYRKRVIEKEFLKGAQNYREDKFLVKNHLTPNS
jgi:hypothetical protein